MTGSGDKGNSNQRRGTTWLAGAALAAILLLAVTVGMASAQEEAQHGAEANDSFTPTPAMIDSAEAVARRDESRLTDPVAAQDLPLEDLDREEALEVTSGVFGPILDATGGLLQESEVKRFLSDYSAIAVPLSEGEDAGPALLESSLPIRTEDRQGNPTAVNLDLEQGNGGLRPEAPLVDVTLPDELGDGIEFPGSGVTVSLAGAPEARGPSVTEDSIATYPNVAEDTDLTLTPTPQGFESFTTLRSPDSPRTQTFDLDVPAGAELKSRQGGGAEVVKDETTVLAISAPSALDANGEEVPATLTLSGASVSIEVKPDPETAWPVLVDPEFIGFVLGYCECAIWNQYGYMDGMEVWSSSTSSNFTATAVPPAYGAGLYVNSQAGPPNHWIGPGDGANWTLAVPRSKEEETEAGRIPSTYIASAHLWMGFTTSPGYWSPWLYAGILDPIHGKWAGNPGNEAVWGYGGNWPAFPHNAGNLLLENGEPGKRDQNAKVVQFGLTSSEFAPTAYSRGAALDAEEIRIEDPDQPSAANPSESKWMDQVATEPISADLLDKGIGVKRGNFYLPSGERIDVSNPCGGTIKNPCPREWKASLPASAYNPATMPTGVNYVAIGAEDAFGYPGIVTGYSAQHEIPAEKRVKAVVKVDHTDPQLALSGTLTEQGSLGTTRPQYTLKYDASDGTTPAPQSGVVRTEVKVDGQLAEAAYAPGCATRNCSISREWTLDATKYSPGLHSVQVIATDGVGRTTSKTENISLTADNTAPTLDASGGFFEGPEGWLDQESYSAEVVASDAGGYGVKQIRLEVDGGLVKSVNSNCAAGGCGGTLSTAVDMSAYSGGVHQAKVAVVDGAGNITDRELTINVNPTGTVPNAEAAATLEAVEGTEPETTVIAPTEKVISPTEMADGNNPELEAGPEGSLVSSGVPVTSVVDSAAEGTIEIEATAKGGAEYIAITPVEQDVVEPDVIKGVAGVSSDTDAGVDTVVRPKYNGALTFQNIRESNSPVEYSWEVDLHEGQTLALVEDSTSAAVFYEDGEIAMLISPEPARDAVGKGVPTSISISAENIITLHVDHRSQSHVYPVVAGTAYEVGYSTVQFTLPPSSEVEEGWESFDLVSAPEPIVPSDGIATASSSGKKQRFFHALCTHTAIFYEPARPYGSVYEDKCGNPFANDPGVAVLFRVAFHGKYFIDKGHEVSHLGGPTDAIGCAVDWKPWQFPRPQRKGHTDKCVCWGKTKDGGGQSAPFGKHITPVARFIGEERGGCGSDCGGQPNPWHEYPIPPMSYYLWASGHVKYHETECIDCY